MYIHLLPSFFDQLGISPKLTKIEIPELSFVLTADKDKIRNGRPYPNKCYLIGNAGQKRKDMCGLLISTDKTDLSEFTSIYTWEVVLNGEKTDLTHIIHNKIKKEDVMYNLVSQSALLQIGGGVKGIKDRVDPEYESFAPIHFQPSMYATIYDLDVKKEDRRHHDRLEQNDQGIILLKEDTYKLRTLDPILLSESIIHAGRFPLVEDAIPA